MEKTFFLSLVIAVYNEGEGLYKLVERIQSSLKEYEGNYEVILIDDRSPDNSWEILCELAAQHEELKIVRFIRNFGQHPALSAGMKLARGEYVVLMDCDLQDEPENIIPMYEKMKAEGKYIIYAKRKRRKDPFRKRFTSKLYNKLLSILSGMEVDPEIGTFRLMHKVVVDSFNKLPENRRYVGGLFYWLGFD
ncbi:MAG: glycosyltransferase family 2 protein, partial [Bacteroidota bacterium]